MLIGTKLFPRSLQLDNWSCASRAIYSVTRHYGLFLPHWLLRSQLKTSADTGTAVHQMIRVLRHHGLRVAYRPKLSWRELIRGLKLGRVAVVHLDGDHIAVAHGFTGTHVLLSDPSILRCPGRRNTRQRFLERWGHWGLIVSRRPNSAKSSRRPVEKDARNG